MYRYLTSLLTFSYDKVGVIGNLSRLDPVMLGIKDVFNKNTIHFNNNPSVPLLCFSLILTTDDYLDRGRTFGEWTVKDLFGVLPAMELERMVAVIGLAYKLPYVPDDSARRDNDVLHFAMSNNAFSFSTTLMKTCRFSGFL